jgi:general secretion pathway protein L
MIRGSWAGQFAAGRLARHVLELNSRLRLPTREEFRSGLEAFVRWWSAELWACLPARWQDRLRHRNLHFFATVNDDRKRVVIVERNNACPSRAFALAPESKQDAASLAGLQRAIRQQGARLDLLVPEETIARRRMKVPLAAKDNLREALKTELDRFTRFEHSEVYFDHSVVETDHDAKTITIDAAIVPRTEVDGIAAALRAAGLKPSGAHLWRESAKSPDATFFSAPTGRSAKSARAITVALGVLVVALDVAAAYVPLWLKIDALSDLQARIEIIKPKVEHAILLERTLTELRGKDAYLVGLKNQTPSVSEVVGELAHVLPESAWLEQLQVGEGKVQLEGFTTAPNELIAPLEQSLMLSDVRFEWPVTVDATAAADRFDISARIERPGKASQ